MRPSETLAVDGRKEHGKVKETRDRDRHRGPGEEPITGRGVA